MKVVCETCRKEIYSDRKPDERIYIGHCVDHRRESNEEMILEVLRSYGPLNIKELLSNVDTGIEPLRRSLKELIEKRKTIRGKGYRFKKNTGKIFGAYTVYICVEDKKKFNRKKTTGYDLVIF